MKGTEPLITVRNAEATKVVATGISFSQQLVRVVRKTLGYGREKCSSRITNTFYQNSDDSVHRTSQSV